MGQNLKVVILTWELAPWRIIGDIAYHCEVLSGILAEKGIDVSVITYDDVRSGMAIGYEKRNEVSVYYIHNPVPYAHNIISWAFTLSLEFEHAISEVYYSKNGKIDLIHAHEWMTMPAAISAKHELNIPFVITLHSIENHRSGGTISADNTSIKSVELNGISEAAKVIVKSDWMKSEVQRTYSVPDYKITSISPMNTEWVDKIIKLYREVINYGSTQILGSEN